MIVYRHIRLDKNEPFYIGIGTRKSRAYDKWRNKIWKSIIAKTPYDVEILFQDLTREQAEAKEREFIALYGRIDLKTGTLANLTNGGDEGGGKANKGRKHTDETKAKLRNRPKTIRTKESREKMSNLYKGRLLSLETKLKISNSLKGKSTGKWSDSQREKNRNYWENIYNPITQFSIDGEFIKVWFNRLIASRELNIPKNDIRECARNHKNNAGGYLFKFGDLSENNAQ